MNLECEIRVFSDSDGKVKSIVNGGEPHLIGTIKAANPAPSADGSVRSNGGSGIKLPASTPQDAVIAETSLGKLALGMVSVFNTVPQAVLWLSALTKIEAGPPAWAAGTDYPDKPTGE